jgi:hypothetical protein
MHLIPQYKTSPSFCIQKVNCRKNKGYIKDGSECFYDYFRYRKDNNCKLKHVMNWLDLFVDLHKIQGHYNSTV